MSSWFEVCDGCVVSELNFIHKWCRGEFEIMRIDAVPVDLSVPCARWMTHRGVTDRERFLMRKRLRSIWTSH